jgi:hypothetical protein
MPRTTEVQYFVLADSTRPYLLAQVRWPDVFQAISAGRPYWQEDPGLFDLPYDPNSKKVTIEQADAIAADWGARLPSDETTHTFEPTLIRRMPADWSNLAPAEKRAWSLEFLRPGRGAAADHDVPSRRRAIGTWVGRLGGDRTRPQPVAPLIEAAPVDHEEELIPVPGGVSGSPEGGDSPEREPALVPAVTTRGTADARTERAWWPAIARIKRAGRREISLRSGADTQ